MAREPAARGPWPVGTRTISFDGRRVEMWYPASPGSDSDKKPATYDLREHLPQAEASKISDAINTPQPCDCVRDLPLDRAHGPYPLIVFFHGAGSFRTQSAALATHWASRGFVVVSPDLPLINLRTALGDPDLGRPFDVGKNVVAAARDHRGPFAELRGAIRSDRIGLVGHSFGGGVAQAARNEPGVITIVTMASGGVGKSDRAIHTMILGGTADGIVPLRRQQSAYEAEPAPARFIAIRDAGHLAFSDLCLIGRDRGGMLEDAIAAGVSVPGIVRRLATDGCRPDNLAPERGLAIVRHATTALLSKTLHCDATADNALDTIRARYPDVVDARRK